MKLELAVEMRRLKMVEDQLAVLQRQANELCDAMIVDVREGYPTATMRMMLEDIRNDVRSALEDWDTLSSRVKAVTIPRRERQPRYRGYTGR